MIKYTSAYTDEHLEYLRIVKNRDGERLAEYRGEESKEMYYFTEKQVEDGIVIEDVA